jgi:tetratricopeptide (TPR) repeat protein
VLCHALTALACFVFLDRLFGAVRLGASAGAAPYSPATGRLLAFCGAVLFAAHPVAVYGVAYLIQRSIVMATMFALLSLAAFVRALTQDDRRALWLSVVLYIAALFSKEHAVMLPAIALAIALLLDKRSIGSQRDRIVLIAAVAAAGALMIYKVRGVIGGVLEYYTRGASSAADAGAAALEPAHTYLGSVATQALLFFKYLLLWLIPYPGWMSVDLRVPIAAGLLQWPYFAAVALFLAWGGVGLALLLRRGRIGLLGLAMLFPWLLFFTEFSTARIQEPFVLYRSYLWMAGLPAALPLLAPRLTPRQLIAACVALTMVFVVVLRERLASFESPLALWDDVVRKNTDTSLFFVDRGYGNRAVALLREGRLKESMSDLDVALRLNPGNAHAYVNRAAVLSRLGEYERGLKDLDRAVEVDPGFAEAHAERCAALMKRSDLAGALAACNTALRLSPDLPTALINRMVLHARALRMQEALADIERVLRIEATNGIALYNRGMIYRDMGRSADSLADLRMSCKAGFDPACAQSR